MNKEEALRKIEELQEFVKELDENKKSYCVGHYKNIELDDEFKDLIFRNDCSINSLTEGDGIIVDKDFVKFVALIDGDGIGIILKGSDKIKEDYDEILWSCKWVGDNVSSHYSKLIIEIMK